jgi:hypothetical protein
MGAWTEIVDFTFTANETSREFILPETITKDDFISFKITHINPTGSGNELRLFANDDTTLTNYYVQSLDGNGTSVSAARINRQQICNTIASGQNFIHGYLKLSENDKYNLFTNSYRQLTSSLQTTFFYITSTTSYTSGLDSLTLASERTDGIGTGSRIQIYRLDAEKVADFTTTSNSTQVDIPVTGSLDPAIGKDSEYLLVSDFIPQNSANIHNLFPNDLTTATNYYSQYIGGIGSSAFAGRVNRPEFASAFSSTQTTTYTHIKLSEIGAFTFQTYEVNNRENVFLINYIGSSTSDAITSITKLNIVSDVTGGIGTGSRFILYKMK